MHSLYIITIRKSTIEAVIVCSKQFAADYSTRERFAAHSIKLAAYKDYCYSILQLTIHTFLFIIIHFIVNEMKENNIVH